MQRKRVSRSPSTGGNIDSSVGDTASVNRHDDQGNHLNEMKEKLHQIQSNKQMLEQKILEYEQKLKQISAEPET